VLRSLVLWPALLLDTFFFGTLSLLGSLVDPSGRFAHRCMVAWSAVNLRCAGVRLVVEGREHVSSSSPQILAANHQSMIDIIALAASLPVPFRFVAKAELFDLPFLGWHMRRAGYIAIVREAPRAAARTLLKAAEKVRSGVNAVIFPEGTRSPTGELLPFKGGGFLLAVKSGAPIVPIGIWGTREVLGKGSLRIAPGRAALVIGPAIATSAYAAAERDRLAERVREAMQACMERAQRLVADPAAGSPGSVSFTDRRS
jgi:1-acyl-sn-glycerol-3-phosphate acyltransferase